MHQANEISLLSQVSGRAWSTLLHRISSGIAPKCLSARPSLGYLVGRVVFKLHPLQRRIKLRLIFCFFLFSSPNNDLMPEEGAT